MVVRKKGGTGDVKSYLNVQSTDCTGNYKHQNLLTEVKSYFEIVSSFLFGAFMYYKKAGFRANL